MPSPKFVLKLLLTASVLNRADRRANWVLIFAIVGTIATMALVGLYLMQRARGRRLRQHLNGFVASTDSASLWTEYSAVG